MSNRILIVEDDKQLARYIELELQHEGYIVEKEHDGKNAVNVIKEGKHDLVLLDVLLPGINGMEICRRVRYFSPIPIIMVTAKDETIDKVMGLDLGADDYITKPFIIEELLARIRVALRKNAISADNHKEMVIDNLVLNTSKHFVKRANHPINLTKREFDLLKYLLLNKGLVLSREQILENVWGFDYVGQTNVVDVYIRYLRYKIDESFHKKLIHTVRGIGYLLEEEKIE